ncbi:MAG: lipid-A-disaccharide synthase, partial [Rhodobacteraceae bacterium]|nr:lipid-A-disaccharide synthase [Paracoccaceae bacterium]
APIVREMTAGWSHPPLILEQAVDKRAAFAAADLALAASGTVSLELAANNVPMVIAHDFNRLTWWMMKRAALIDTVTLVNIVSETRAVPEFLGPDCQPGLIAGALARLLQDPAARAAQRSAENSTMERLGRGQEDPGLRAARSVVAGIGGRWPLAGR